MEKKMRRINRIKAGCLNWQNASRVWCDKWIPVDGSAGTQTLIQTIRPYLRNPSLLPPERIFNHKMHLQPNPKQSNVCPYCYPYFQKTRLENMFKSPFLLLIQYSNSSFSSPVLLMKKKDGTWRFCIKNRALNALTAKDGFFFYSYGEWTFRQITRCKVDFQIGRACWVPSECTPQIFIELHFLPRQAITNFQ